MKTKKKKIWILQTGEPVHSDSNLRPMRAINLSNALVKKGHHVTLWTSSFFHQEKKHRFKSFHSLQINENLVINFIPSPGYKSNIGFGRLFDHAILAFNFFNIIRRSENLPDKAFIGYPPIETSFIFSRWLIKNNIPYYVDLKDQWPHIFLEPFPKPIQFVIKIILFPYFYMGKYSLKNSKGYISMSSGYIDWMNNFGGNSSKSFIAPLTVKRPSNSLDFSDEILEWFKSENINFNNDLRFCFIGSFMSVFDFLPVRHAIEELNSQNYDFEVLMCGDGGFYDEIKQEFSSIHNVKFTGWINEEQIRAIYKISRASLVPYKNIDNYKINTPNKVVDAFANKRPIITSLKGEVERLCNSYRVGFACHSDTNLQFFDAMRLLLTDNVLNNDMRNNAYKLYEEIFSFDKVYDSLAEFIINN